MLIRAGSSWVQRISPLLFVAGLFQFGASCANGQTSGVVRELYTGVAGSSVAELTNAAVFPSRPTDVFLESSFEAPLNFADAYGQRMRALLCPPVTGTYTFWIASDDNSVLYLSTDETPGHKVVVAYENLWTGWRAWNTHTNQKSAPVTLTGGARYYIEALQKEGAGGDSLSVTWQKPGDAAPADGAAPIPGTYLLAYGLGPPVISGQPANYGVVEGGSASFTVTLAVKLGATYQWQRGGAAIAGATNSVYTLVPATIADNGSQFSCAITNWFGSTNSATASLTVIADTTRPSLSSAGSLGESQVLSVVFSEPVELATATDPGNYSINNGVLVLSAAMGMDTRTVILTTSPMTLQTNYVLTVNRVRDRAASPNEVLPNSQYGFTLDPVPLDISFVKPAAEFSGPSSRHGPVVISELMYHPATRQDGKNLEFVELSNPNGYYEDISGYRLSGDIDFVVPTNTLLAARAVLVVAASPADLQSVYGSMIVLGPYTNSLPNGSGTVRLKNRRGGTVFEVNYSSDPPWPAAADGAGHSLVLARPSLGERNSAAWMASGSIGGSPARTESAVYNAYKTVVINEILAHTDPPDVDYVELFNYSSVSVDLGGCVLTDDPDTNRFVIPTGTTIPAMGFVVFDESQLGFGLSAAGETIYFKDPLNTRVLDEVRFTGQENGVALGRSPDGAEGFYRLEGKTPGAANARQRQSEVVINEIMYAPLSSEDSDQYVELYNRTASPIDVSKWSLEDGIKYTIPSGTVISGNGYLVVAKDAMRLMSNYGNLNGLNTVGNFSGTLARGGERLALAKPDEIVSTNSAGLRVTNHIHIVVDEVTYGVGGRWGTWAHGGGSSLELVDPASDHRRASNWADSDETGKGSWTTVEFTGILDNGNGTADSLQIITLGAGEYLVDNVEVSGGGGANIVTNADFESGLTGWYCQGNHEDSGLEVNEGYSSSRSLHVRAPDHGDTGANRIRTKLRLTLNSGQTVTIRAKVRWLAGHPEILFRLHGNWLEATGSLVTGRSLGTPGLANSRARFNIGPAITDVRHMPILPGSGQQVTVAARVHDPDGLATLLLKYRIDPSTNWTVVNMKNNGAGLFSGVIPGQLSGRIAAFYVEALDNKPPRQVSRFPNDAPARDCLVRFGDTAQSGSFGIYRLWMTQATFDRWSQRERLSNKPLDCTLVYGNTRVIYNIGGQYSGSPYHAPGFDSPTGNVCDYLLTFNEDEPLLGETSATLQWPGNGGGDNSYQREQTAYWIAEQAGLPYCYRRSINLLINGVRRAEMFEDVQQPGGDMMEEYYPSGDGGDLHKVQLWFEFDDAASTFDAVGASLQNVTTTGGQKKLARYRWTFAKRAFEGSANNYSNLFKLVDAANFGGLGANYRRQLEANVDVENWLRTYAVEHIVGNPDSFAYGGGQNLYTYKPLGDTWKMLIWDIDFAFWVADPASDVFQGIGRSNGIDLGEPAYKRRYWQILQDLALGPLNGTRLFPLLDAKYNAMVANGRSVENPAAIKNYISQRRANLLSLISTNVASNFAITLNGGAGFSTSQNFVTLTGLAPIDVRTITINGGAYDVTWTTVTNWSAQVALGPGTNSLLVQGWSSSSNAVAGATASIAINYTGVVSAPEQALAITEIMYNPASPDASFVELHNNSANAFDLSGWKLNGADFVFPGGTVIRPDSYLVIPGNRLAFASAYGATIPLTGEFGGKLQNSGETLQLIKPGAIPDQDSVIDEVRYESAAPWPPAANGFGPSLQLIDTAQEDDRVANWGVATNAPPGVPAWRYVVAGGVSSSSTIYVYLQSAGETYIDDIKLVPGTVAGSGTSVLANGDFETALTGPWQVSANLAGSSLSTATKHSGNSSLHLVASSGGSTRASSIYQDISPALPSNAAYTLSFWVRENTNGGILTVRLANSGIFTNVNLLPGGGTPVLTSATPGAANSIRATLPPLPRLWLNEVVPLNSSGLSDRFGHRHPWVELYNNGPTNLPLSGMFLANNYTNLLQWPFPAGATINPGQFLVVWLGSPAESTQSELHTSFAVAPSSGSVVLVSTNGGRTNVIDYLNYAGIQPDRSYGAFPNGSPTRRQPFYFTTPAATNDPSAPLLNVAINEWMADNRTTLADPVDNDFEDWFELYNAGPTPANISGYYLGQALTNRTKFKIPDGYIIPAYGYLLVWADDETGQNSTNNPDLHVNFKLSKNGDGIGLFAPDPQATVIDFISFGVQATDVSEGRFPDGWPALCTLASPSPRGTNFALLPNTSPDIDAIRNYSIFEGQVLSIQVRGSDTNLPEQKLTYTLDPGAPFGAALNPETGLFSWRPSAFQTPSTNQVTVRVTDDGIPPLSSARTFEVKVLARPQITAVHPDGTGAYLIEFITVRGKTYSVEYKNDLRESVWNSLTPPQYMDGESFTTSDPGPFGPQRFYRVIVTE